MNNLTIEGNHISLPWRIVKKFSGRRIELVETEEGILIKPGSDVIKEARGLLKGSHINSKSYLAQKEKDKELDRYIR